MECITITLIRCHMRYRTFSLSLAWFGGYLQRVTLFFNKQSILDPRPKNCLSFSKKLPQKIV